MKPIDIQLEVELAGARLEKEKSRALPMSYYGDPAKSIKFASEKKPKDNKKGGNGAA